MIAEVSLECPLEFALKFLRVPGLDKKRPALPEANSQPVAKWELQHFYLTYMLEENVPDAGPTIGYHEPVVEDDVVGRSGEPAVPSHRQPKDNEHRVPTI